MRLTEQEARDIVYEDHEDWETVETEIEDTTRWSIVHSGVFKHLPTGKHYFTYWSVGATETQDQQPFEYDEPVFNEVKQVEKVVKVWECIDDLKDQE